MLSFTRHSDNTSIARFGELTLKCFSAKRRLDLFESEEFRDSLSMELDRFAECGGKLLSLDVFDTVLLRNEKSDIRRFYEMAELFAADARNQCGARHDATGFLYARITSTKNSYRFSRPVKGCREGSLEEIHLGIARMLGLPPEFAKRMTRIELEYERENLMANPALGPMLEAAKRHDIGVVLISDMYMGREHISTLLETQFPGLFHHMRIFSSSDLKISKRSGFLFDHVIDELRGNPDRAMHIGDNLLTDYLSPRKQGWNAVYLPHTDSEHQSIDLDEKCLHAELIAQGFDLKALLVD